MKAEIFAGAVLPIQKVKSESLIREIDKFSHTVKCRNNTSQCTQEITNYLLLKLFELANTTSVVLSVYNSGANSLIEIRVPQETKPSIDDLLGKCKWLREEIHEVDQELYSVFKDYIGVQLKLNKKNLHP